MWLDICRSRWQAKFMAAGHLFPRKIGRRLVSACVLYLYQRDMPAASVIHLVALRNVAPVFAAVTLRWLHDGGDRALLDHNFGVWAQDLLAPGEIFGYDDFATVDACPLPPQAPLSLAGSRFLADSVPPRPTTHPEDAQAFVECSHNFVVNTASITNEDDDGFAPVAPLNGQLMCGLVMTAQWMRMRTRMGGRSLALRCTSARVARRAITRTASGMVSVWLPRRLVTASLMRRGRIRHWLNDAPHGAAVTVSRRIVGVSARW